MEDFYLNIDLSKLFRAFMKEFNDKNGVKTKCICIPVEDNGIYTGFSDIAKIALKMRAYPKDEKTHFITLSGNKAFFEKLKAQGIERTPIIGNAKIAPKREALDKMQGNSNYQQLAPPTATPTYNEPQPPKNDYADDAQGVANFNDSNDDMPF